MAFDDISITGLSLGSVVSIDMPQNQSPHYHQEKKKLMSLKFDHVFPSLTLGLSSQEKNQEAIIKIIDDESTALHRQASNSLSAVSSYSNSIMKREREEEVELDKVCNLKVNISGNDDQEDQEGSARKKLRLTKEQSVILEGSFKEHSTLNPKQKQALAKQLNLLPRQVEVWFQNRRARTKLKQTEVECELLKKCCETLKDENRRLQKEVQELKAIKVTTPFYVQLPATTLTVCPSCERIGESGENSSRSPFSVGAKSQLYNPLASPSAAC